MAKVFAVLPAVAVAASCTGSADPVITTDTCYQGAAGALGLKETVLVNIHSFAAPSASLDISGTGIEAFTCAQKSATKSGQEIDVDFGTDDCLPSGIEVSDVKYCSDQDEIRVTVKDKAVPLPISAQLKKIACGSKSPSMFDDFKQQYGKVYDGDESHHEAAFNANVQKIIASNREEPGHLLGVTEFADLTPEEFKAQFLSGYRGEKTSNEVAYLGKHVYSGAALPDSIDWSQQGAVTPIKNQGSCGSCWAFSTVGSLEGRNQIATENLVSLSEQQFVDCDKVADQGCNGGLMDNAFKYVMSSDGVCTEDSYSYTGTGGSCQASSCTIGVKSISGYKDVDGTEEALAEAVAEGPVSVAVDAETVFQLYHGGVVKSNFCGATLDHGVLVVGYGVDSGTKYWKVKNSWGASWGESGYIRLLKGKGGTGECGILTGPPSYPVIGSSITV